MEWEIFQVIWILMLGSVVGSFLNVCAMRIPAGESIVRPRSFTDCCRRPLPWYDNVPLISFLLLRGKCRYCHARISVQHPLAEAATVLLALAVWLQWGWTWLALINFVLCSLLVIVFLIDLHHYIIPNVITFPGMGIGFSLSVAGVLAVSWRDSLLGFALGGGLLWLIAVLYQKVRKREGLGGGDIKLLGMLGTFIGVKGVLLTLFISSLLGGAVGLYAMIVHRKGRHYALPFGPFIVIGAVIYLFFGETLLDWYFQQYLQL
ncbi:MAG: prepilin peptidase [Deltaproteobacteria bacterium]|nr:prepilin peptidase [Deltaproteobacteria bacterium]